MSFGKKYRLIGKGHFEGLVIESESKDWAFDSEVVMKRIDYPDFICDNCANSLGHKNKSQASSYCHWICGWCNNPAQVTEPRDFGYPPFQKK